MNNTDTQLHEKLTGLGARLGGDDRFVEQVLRLIQTRTIAPAPSSAWRRAAGVGIAMAAAALVGIGVWLAIGGGDAGAVYAQVVRALADVRTVHFVATNFDEHGNPTPAGEGWYQRDVGLRMTAKLGVDMTADVQGWVTVYDDGKQLLTVTAADPTPRQADSIGLMGALRTALLTDQAFDRAARDRTGDTPIDGDRCRMFFRRSDRPGAPSDRYWIDLENRVRRVEHLAPDGQGWRVAQRVDVQYDVPVDRSLLVYKPPPTTTATTTKPVDIDASAKQLLSLDQAILTKEALGLIVAVHEVRPCTDGSIVVLSSLRPTKQTLDKYGTGFGPRTLGDHHFTFSTAGGTTYYAQQIGQYENGRLYARWDLMVPQDPPKAWPQKLELRGDVWTRDRLYDDLNASGERWYANELPMGDVPLPPGESAEPLEQLVSRVWRQAQPLHALFSPVRFLDVGKPIGGGKFEVPTHPLDWWTESKLIDAVRQEKARQQRAHDEWRKAHPKR